MSGLTFSNGTVNLSQVDTTFSENFESTWSKYSISNIDISKYMFAPYIDYTEIYVDDVSDIYSSYIHFCSPFTDIRVIVVGGGGGGGGSGHDGYGRFGFQYGGAGGGGGCGQINSTIFRNVSYYATLVRAGGVGGNGGTYSTNNFGDGKDGASGGTNTFSYIGLGDYEDGFIEALGGGGGKGGFDGMKFGSEGFGGAGGTSYGWVNNVNYYGVKPTDGDTSSQKSKALVKGGKGGYLNGWCNIVSIQRYGSGGEGGYSASHSDYTSVFNSSNMDNGVGGGTGESGFTRVYFIK